MSQTTCIGYAFFLLLAAGRLRFALSPALRIVSSTAAVQIARSTVRDVHNIVSSAELLSMPARIIQISPSSAVCCLARTGNPPAADKQRLVVQDTPVRGARMCNLQYNIGALQQSC